MPRTECDSLIREPRAPGERFAPGGFAAIIAACSVLSADAAAVRMWSKGVVDADHIRVRDVAQVVNGVPDEGERYAEVVVAPAPRPGEDVEVTLDDLRDALVRAGANPAEFTMCGAVRCQVVRPLSLRPGGSEASEPRADKGTWWWPGGSSGSEGVGGCAPESQASQAPSVGTPEPTAVVPPQPPPAPSGTLEGVVTRYVSEKLESVGGRVHVRFSANAKNALSLSRPEYDFRVHWRSEPRLGPCSLEVDILQEGQLKQTLPMVVEVSLTLPVVVAARPINRGQVVRESDVQLQACDFFHLDRIGLTDPGMVIGQQARRFIRSGEMIYLRDLKSSPLVRPGDLVTVWSEVGGLKIKTVGKAVEGGTYGETIAVRNESSRQTFQATVVGPLTVQMHTGMRSIGLAGSLEREDRP